MKNLPLAAIFGAVIIFFGSCSSTPMSIFSGSQVISDDIAGIVHAGGSRTQTEYAYLDYLGLNWILHTFSWGTLEPYQGEWDFLVHDALVAKAKSSGIKIIGILAYDNWWIYDDKDTHRNITPEVLPDYLEYVRKTAEHYRGRVDAWCIWNEPNTSRFWKGTREDFFELTRQAAAAIREVDSEVIILGGAVNRGVFGLPEKFTRGLFESGAMDNIDAVAFHPYELNPGRALLLYDRFRKIVNDYGFGDKIWITEVGYPTGGWYPTKVREKNFPEYVVKTFVNLAAAGAQRILWYQLFDPPLRDKDNSESFFGLVRSRRDYTSKGAEAFRLCATYLPDTSCSVLEDSLLRSMPNSLRAFWFARNDETGGALVLWNEGLGSIRIRLQLPGTDHARHDPVSGDETSIPAETVIRIGKMPVFITWTLPGGALLQGDEKRPVVTR